MKTGLLIVRKVPEWAEVAHAVHVRRLAERGLGVIPGAHPTEKQTMIARLLEGHGKAVM